MMSNLGDIIYGTITCQHVNLKANPVLTLFELHIGVNSNAFGVGVLIIPLIVPNAFGFTFYQIMTYLGLVMMIMVQAYNT